MLKPCAWSNLYANDYLFSMRETSWWSNVNINIRFVASVALCTIILVLLQRGRSVSRWLCTRTETSHSPINRYIYYLLSSSCCL